MPIIRNPFAKREPLQDENVRPGSSGSGFEKTNTLGSRGSSALSIASRKVDDENVYKMSVVNDGVYLPPSPPEKKSFFSRRFQNSSSSTRNKSGNPALNLPPIEPFSISRESFDSYRRSFDISARTPLSHNNSASSTEFPSAHGRQSLDARLPGNGSGLGRSSMAYERPFPAQTPHEEKEEFEDVMLDRDRLTPAVAPKRSFFSRLGEKSLDGMAPIERTTSKEAQDMPLSSRFHFGLGGATRKRAHSGTGQELGTIERPTTNTVPVENKQEVAPTR